jgi:hypothetical protein
MTYAFIIIVFVFIPVVSVYIHFEKTLKKQDNGTNRTLGGKMNEKLPFKFN